MNEELREQILQLIREELSIDVDTKCVDTGSYDGPLYKDVHVITLTLCDECIASVYLG